MITQINHKNNVKSSVVTAVVFWGVASFFLGYYRVFRNFPAISIGLATAFLIAVLTLFYLYSKPFRAFAEAIPLKSIALFHSFRIAGGLLFIANTGLLPQIFVNHVGYGDIISGVLAIGVLVLGQTKRNYLLFNMVGILDLINALRLGFSLTLSGNEQMQRIGELPLIMIILFIVPILVISHIISFNRLLKEKNKALNEIIK